MLFFFTKPSNELSDSYNGLLPLLLVSPSAPLVAGIANYDLAVFLKSLFEGNGSNVDLPFDSSNLRYYLTFLGGFFLS